MKPSLTFAKQGQRGSTLVGLMVSLVIGMMVSLAALSSIKFFGLAHAQSVGLGGAVNTTSTVTAVFKQELAQAGRGMMGSDGWMCSSLNLAKSGTVLYDNVAFFPLSISKDKDGNPTLDLFYASKLEAATSVGTNAGTVGGSAELSGYLPVSVGDAVLIAPPKGQTGPCLIRSVTAVTAQTAFSGMTLTFGENGVYNGGSFSTEYSYTKGSRVTVLGTLNHTRFSLKDGVLKIARPLEDQSATLAENVIGLDFLWGAATSTAQPLSRWLPVALDKTSGEDWTTLTASRLAQLRALKVGIVVRTAQAERPASDGKCTASATDNKPTLFGTSLSLPADWQCYRYRESQSIIPVNNILQSWGS